ncbi:MAG: family 43 glycosylhydrolase [Clostridiales bacterium]|nr:family 43 glycosylhydrolase [Clostridiales bacterium]
MRKTITGSNPILRMDFPDPDVIFVDGVYYMISTTMHFLPGGQILRSYDLLNWEHAAYVFDYLDGTDAQKLADDKYVYGKGMWAASLRYHKGTFYVAFVCNDTQKTYLFRSGRIEGPWVKSEIEGFYHDCSLLFDDDDWIYIVYGNRQVYLTELDAEMTRPKEGGLHRLLLQDSEKTPLGYEGSHLYKINGRYYLFMIHSLEERWRRVEACFSSDSLEGEFTGGDVLNDDMGFRDSGVAQGGIVCGVDGIWNAILFQDSGAVGRIPVVVPVTWEKETLSSGKEEFRPVFGIDGKVPHELTLPVSDAAPEGYGEEGEEAAASGLIPLTGSDDFKYGFEWGKAMGASEDGEAALTDVEFRRRFGCFGFRSIWQFNHEPDLDLVFRDEKEGKLWITTDKLSLNLNHAKNTLTQRILYPEDTAEVTIDASHLNDGDCAGLCILQGNYCWVGVEKKDGKLYEVMYAHTSTEGPWDLSPVKGDLIEERLISPDVAEGAQNKEDAQIHVRIEVHFEQEKDEASCAIRTGEAWQEIGKPHQLRFRLDHFTGARFGLFVYSQETAGGRAGFSEFIKGK